MNKILDIEIFKALYKDLGITEVYLGSVPFVFKYSQVNFTATCTESFPLNPFDKVICELLKLNESLSFNEIGDILGLNVHSMSSQNKVIDFAEKEILIGALQSLQNEFGMIEGGDIDFSQCKLTDIGRLYANQGAKFKNTANKKITLYFDHTTEQHIYAKENFEYILGNRIEPIELNIYKDENFLREIAEKQIPDIQNTQKQNSFKDTQIKKISSFSAEYSIALSYDFINDHIQVYCYNQQSKSVNALLTDWIRTTDKTKQEILGLFFVPNQSIDSNGDSVYQEYKEVLLNANQNLETVNHISYLLTQNLIDYNLFILNLRDVLTSHSSSRIYICLNYINDYTYNSLVSIFQKEHSEYSKYFIVLPEDLNEEIQGNFDEFEELSYNIPDLYLLQKPVKSFVILIKLAEDSIYFEEITTQIAGTPKCLIQKRNWDEKADRIEKYFLEQFADSYALDLCKSLVDEVTLDIDEKVDKEQLDEVILLETKLLPFVGIGRSKDTITQALNLAAKFKEERIEEFENSLMQEIQNIEALISSAENVGLLKSYQKDLTKLEEQILSKDSQISFKCKTIKDLINLKEFELEEARKIYHFILDSNVFIDDPDILRKINQKHQFILSAKVIDELDNLKKNPECKTNAELALRNINQHLRKKNVRLNQGKLSLLPPDFSKKSPDNLILSVALMYRNTNGILVTSDNGLQLKAQSVELHVLSTVEFIERFKIK